MPQGGGNAELLAHMLEQMGQNVSRNLNEFEDHKLRMEKLKQEAAAEVDKFMRLPADQRQKRLADPKFAAQLVRWSDPDTFFDPKKAKKITIEDMNNRINMVKAWGLETPEEKAAREKLQADASIAQENQTQQHLITGRMQGVIPQGTTKQKILALTTGPNAMKYDEAQKFVTLTEEQDKEAAQRNAKAGPAYQDDVRREFIKWGSGPEMGLPPDVADKMALAISTGNYQDIPQSYVDPASKKVVPILSMAMQHLKVDQQNADTARQTMVHNEQSSIVTSAQELLKNGGALDLNLDQAIADIKAMRAGKPVPFKTPALATHAANDLTIQQQTIEKNMQAILDDKYGIPKIQESLRTMMEAIKQEGTFSGNLSSAQLTDLKDKYAKTMEQLHAAMSGRYGIKFDDYYTLHGGLKRAAQTVWDGMKTGLAFPADAMKELDANFQSTMRERDTASIMIGAMSEGVGADTFKPIEHTPDQKLFLDNLMKGLSDSYNAPSTRPEDKMMIKKFISEKVHPAILDAAKIPDLITPFKPESSHEPDLPSQLPDFLQGR